MSKIGQRPIPLPQSVKVEVQDKHIVVVGPKGQLQYDLPTFLSLKQEGDILNLACHGSSKREKSGHGLWRSLIANGVKGVVDGWQKSLEVIGTGFNAKMQGATLVLKLGLSHPVNFSPPENIQISVNENKVAITGIDKQLVGQVADQIISLKRPDPYKGKGIRYEGQHIKLKPGKKAKTE